MLSVHEDDACDAEQDADKVAGGLVCVCVCVSVLFFTRDGKSCYDA